jgi:hypothetical protein
MSHERRRHRVFYTQRTEYHLRDAECVGVRDRSSGEWIAGHAALRLYALAIPEKTDEGAWIGQRIQFWGRDTDVLTSPVVAVGRPEIDEVISYVSQARAGIIHEHPSPKLKASLPAAFASPN